MITEGLQNIAEGFKKKFSRETVAATVGNPRNATRQMTQRKPAPIKAMGIKKPTVGKVGSVDTAFFTKAAEKKNPKLQKNDSVADVAGKLFSFIKTSEQERKVHFELSRDFEKENITEDTRRHNELVEALKKQREEKEKKKEPEKKEEKKPEEKKKEEPEKKAPEKAETKAKEKPKKEEVKKTEAKKEEPKKEEPQTAKPTTEAKPPVTAKPVEPAPAAPQAPAPTATVPKPAPKIPTAAKAAGAVAAALVPSQLGKLSSKFETGGKKDAGAIIGYDSTGGTSYGTYQIASKVGAMSSFLSFLDKKGEKDIVNRLKSAGDPNTGSTKGAFPDEWKKISAERGKDFDKLQHEFIEETQFKPAAKRLLQLTGYDIDSSPETIKDVFFSTVVQHGPGGTYKKKDGSTGYSGAVGIFKSAIDENGGEKAKPEDIIKSVYSKRATKFESSTEKVRASVQERFKTEQSDALSMLSKENEDLKKQGAPGTTVIMDNSQTNISQSAPSKQKTLAQGSSPDLPAHQQG